MAVSQEVETRILRKMVKSLLNREKVSLNEVRRIIGNFSQEIGEKTEEVAEIVGAIYKEAVTEAFDPKLFERKSR